MIEFLTSPVPTGLLFINLLILIIGICILERRVRLLQEFMKIQNEINKLKPTPHRQS
jgi:hypothetical protein